MLVDGRWPLPWDSFCEEALKKNVGAGGIVFAFRRAHS